MEVAKQISDTIWEIPVDYKEGMRLPARIYGTEKLIREMDETVCDQVTNVATLPGIAQYALCMPVGILAALAGCATLSALNWATQLQQYLLTAIVLVSMNSAACAICYILAKEIIWDVHDAEGDRVQGIVTVANRWGTRVAFIIAWGLIGLLIGSIPIALLLLPMTHLFLFAVFSPVMLLSLGTALVRFQLQRSVSTYEGFILWERLSVLFGVIGLLGTAPPL